MTAADFRFPIVLNLVIIALATPVLMLAVCILSVCVYKLAILGAYGYWFLLCYLVEVLWAVIV